MIVVKVWNGRVFDVVDDDPMGRGSRQGEYTVIYVENGETQEGEINFMFDEEDEDD